MYRVMFVTAFALFFFTSFALTLHPASALAATIAPGDRVRASYDPKQTVTGTVVSLDGQGIVIHPDGATDNTTVATGTVRSLERLEGEKSCWATGMLIGGMAGLIGGVIWAAADEDPIAGSVALVSAPVGGAVLGTLIGAFIKTDKWESVPLSGLEVGMITGDAHGVAVSWNLRF